jgi:MYXO-CTERM domain-containing protein
MWSCTGEPSVCTEDTLCGNGVLDDVEQCDDGGLAADDGCAADCTLEDGFTCDGEPSVCVADSDGDGVGDDDDNCPDVDNPGQADEDGDGIGNACDDVDEPDDGDGGGCCSVGGRDRATGWLFLAGVVGLALRRRRRRA